MGRSTVNVVALEDAEVFKIELSVKSFNSECNEYI
jgi:hypothetical protein